MELLMWLMEIEIWRLQRKEHSLMVHNDKITGNPKQPGIPVPNHLELYRRATEETRRILETSTPDMLKIWHESVPEFYQNEMLTRVNDDARHGKRRR